jgi:hypothetical protein
MKSKQYVNEVLLEHILVDVMNDGPLLARGTAHEHMIDTFEADVVYAGWLW